MPPFNPTRRALIAASLAVTATAHAQGDGYRVIRARPNGYDGLVPGPTLRVRRGEEVRVRLVNELPVETAIHWHGVRVPNAMDGTALTQKPVAPGASFDYRFTPPDAGTFWFHPPLRTAENRALHGLLIVDEAQPVEADRDVALAFDFADGKFTANGLSALDIPVTAMERLRLRLVNVAERTILVRVDNHPMLVVAIDGQPAEPFPSQRSQINLGPGNRVDVLIDAVKDPGETPPIVVQNDDKDVPAARLVYAGTPAVTPRGPGKALPANTLPERMDLKGALRAELSPDAIAATLPAKPLFAVKRGRTVVLAIRNPDAALAMLHIHGHSVRLLDALDDGWKPFWLDTILCLPRQTTRVAFVADNPGKWLMQWRAIGAEAPSLTWFEVN